MAGAGVADPEGVAINDLVPCPPQAIAAGERRQRKDEGAYDYGGDNRASQVGSGPP